MPTLLRSMGTLILALALIVLAASPVRALEWGEVGNSPVDDPGWPEGAAAVFNVSGRVAWCCGGALNRWRSDYRGDAEAFNGVLANFELTEAAQKQVIVHDGIGRSYWLKTYHEDLNAQVDWIFAFYQSGASQTQIDVYVGGNIDWADVVIPEGIEVVDNRLESHGFSLADGNVIEGTVHDLATGEPLAATMQLVLRVQGPDGVYRYASVVETVDCDDQGHWVLTSAPEGMHQIHLSADGYAPRVVGYADLGDQPSWSSYDTGLVRVATSGTVDDSGNPLKVAP